MYLSENRKQTNQKKQNKTKQKKEKIKYNAQINMYDLTKFGGTEGTF